MISLNLSNMDERLAEALEHIEDIKDKISDQQYKSIIDGLMIGHSTTDESKKSDQIANQQYVQSLQEQYSGGSASGNSVSGWNLYELPYINGYQYQHSQVPDQIDLPLLIKGENHITRGMVSLFCQNNPENHLDNRVKIQHKKDFLHRNNDLFRLYLPETGEWSVWLNTRSHIKRMIWDKIELSDSQILSIYSIIEDNGSPSVVASERYVLSPKIKVRIK